VGVSLTHPLLAWGALLALLPILVHLLQRRRPRPHPFAAMELVLRSQRENVRRLRLRRLLLLLARTAILLSLPLAIARPHFTAAVDAVASPEGPAATAIVLDASLSMRWGGGKLMENARQDARRVLADRLPEEPVSVLVCDGRPLEAEAPGFDRSRARRRIDEAQPSHLAADLTSCLAAAAASLAESPLPAKRIFVATDLTANAWQMDAPPPTVSTEAGEVQPEVVVLDAARGSDLPNVAITDLRVEPAPELGSRGHAIAFSVHNFGSEDVRDLGAELWVGDELVTRSFLDVPAGGSAQKRLLHRFPAGGTFAGAVRLTPDELAEDDSRDFVVHVSPDLRVLVVNGAPSPIRYRDEAFFVETALRAGGTAPLDVRTIDADNLPHQGLDGLDVVFLLNVRAPDPKVAEKLARFVREGGGLFFALGDQVDADAYNTAFGELLPLALHLPKTLAAAGEGPAGARFSDFDLDHPILRIFSGAALEGLDSVRTHRYFLLQPGESARVLATFDDGAPALVEKELGEGRVILFASTADRDWSDWAIQTSFLPAMQQMASHLARSLGQREAPRAQVGESVALPALEGTSAVVGPDGREIPHAKTEGESLVVTPEQPGVHRLVREGAEPEPAFAAFPSPSESDTRRLDPRELRALLGGAKAEVAQDAGLGRKRETPLWSLLLLAGLLAFCAEGFLLRK
jgi:hypothetical protein